MTRQPHFLPETSSSTGQPTPASSLSPTSNAGHHPSRHASPSPLRNSSKTSGVTTHNLIDDDDRKRVVQQDRLDTSHESQTFEMQSITEMPPGGHNVPLLADKDNDRNHGSSGRPALISRGSHLHTQAPKYPQPEDQTKRKYIYAGFFLLLSLVSFVVQTETAVYIQRELHWNKAYCMLWLTHGSWSLLWPAQLLILRIQKRKQSWPAFWRRHKALLTSTAQMVQHQDLYLSSSKVARSPWPYMLKTTAFVTTFLTFAGASWYVAVDWTSPSDLTAIYNCSAFFAYVFSIYILHDKIRFDKVFSVLLAVAGVLVVAYGDSDDASSDVSRRDLPSGSTNPNPDRPPGSRLFGNLIIGIGSVLYGLYEVLYKRYACPPEGASPNRGMMFANTFGSMIGLFTLTVLWIPLPILHFTGIERFELPRGRAASLLAISTLSNAVFSGSFLVLMSLTSPVLSSVAALLTIFLVALTDWVLTGKKLSPAAIGGGTLIIIAFLMLSWATYREMKEEARKRELNDDNKVLSDDEDDDDEDDDSHPERAGEREGLVQGDELDTETGRTRGARSNSAVVVRGDASDWENDSDDDDQVNNATDLSSREGKMRRHRNS